MYDIAAALLRSAGLDNEPPTLVQTAQDAISWLSRTIAELDEHWEETPTSLAETLAHLLAVWAFTDAALQQRESPLGRAQGLRLVPFAISHEAERAGRSRPPARLARTAAHIGPGPHRAPGKSRCGTIVAGDGEPRRLLVDAIEVTRVVRAGLRLDCERDARWCDRHRVDAPMTWPCQRVSEPSALRPKGRERALHLVLGTSPTRLRPASARQ